MFHLLWLTQHNTQSVGFWVIEGFILMLTCGLFLLWDISIIIRSLSHLFRHRDALNVAVPVNVPFVSHRLELCQKSFSIGTPCRSMLVMWVCGFRGRARVCLTDNPHLEMIRVVDYLPQTRVSKKTLMHWKKYLWIIYHKRTSRLHFRESSQRAQSHFTVWMY